MKLDMDKRLTWQEIKNSYPNRWVGLGEIEWDAPDGVNVVSALVRYVEDKPDKLYDMQIDGQDVYTTYTTPETFPYGKVFI
ncbi:MAG: hypothetical protein IKN12_06105 [Selenomonadaceae bacterium]|nr:hypothetical protein [Selenomonadaceae bacterium]MBR3722324.1 hypothetical protein [Selenomonadaceae bacterium]